MLIVCGSERWTSCPINHEKANWMALPGVESVHSERGRLAVECPPVCGVVSGQRKPWQRGYGAAQARHSLPELTGSPGRWPASKTAPISIWSGLNQMPAASGMTPAVADGGSGVGRSRCRESEWARAERVLAPVWTWFTRSMVSDFWPQSRPPRPARSGAISRGWYLDQL